MIDLIRKWLDATSSGPAEAWPTYAAPDIVMRFPFAPPGVAKEHRGRAQAIAALSPIWKAKESFAWHDVVIRRTEDPELYVITARSEVVFRPGRHYANSYVILTRMRDRKVVEHVEYFDPLPVIEIFGLPSR